MCRFTRRSSDETRNELAASRPIPPRDDPDCTLPVEEVLKLLDEEVRRDSIETARFVEEETKKRRLFGFTTSTG